MWLKATALGLRQFCFVESNIYINLWRNSAYFQPTLRKRRDSKFSSHFVTDFNDKNKFAKYLM